MTAEEYVVARLTEKERACEEYQKIIESLRCKIKRLSKAIDALKKSEACIRWDENRVELYWVWKDTDPEGYQALIDALTEGKVES